MREWYAIQGAVVFFFAGISYLLSIANAEVAAFHGIFGIVFGLSPRLVPISWLHEEIRNRRESIADS
jgi:hypothetical protein